MKEVRLCLEVLTPMFLGGANPARCELRGASVRGQLRFWWRAQQADLSIEELWRKEASIFGAAGEKRAGRSSFSVEVVGGEKLQASREPLPQDKQVCVQIQRSSGREIRVNLLEYLAYGTFKWNPTSRCNVLQRDYFAPGFRFWVVLRFRDPRQRDEVLKALRAFCLFGALGAKARNGYGSFAVVSAEGVEEALVTGVPNAEVMKELCKKVTINDTPPFSAFCNQARLFRTKELYSDWASCLAALARAWREARLSLEKHHVYEKRQYLGAPIVVNKETVSLMERRAKPYFLRVHRERERERDKYRGYILYLPSQYLPAEYHRGLGIDQKKFPQGDSQRKAHEEEFKKVCEKVNETLRRHLEEVVFCPRS